MSAIHWKKLLLLVSLVFLSICAYANDLTPAENLVGLGKVDAGDEVLFESEHDIDPKAYLEKAEQGDVRAQYELGMMYLKGNPLVDQDFKRAAFWFRQVVFSGDTEHALDAILALHSLRKDAVRQYPSIDPAAFSDMQSPPPGVILINEGRVNEGIDLLIRLAWLLDARSQLYLQIIYEHQVGDVPAHHPKVLEFYRASAAEGMQRSILFLAKIRYYGWGVERNTQAAINLATLAEGLHEAKKLLGDIHFAEGDAHTAEVYWQKAAEMGSADGAYELGVSYRDRKEFKKAVIYFEKAIDLQEDLYLAMMNLGQIYIEGWGVDPNPVRGFSYYKQVADEAEGEVMATAQYVVGLCYLKGAGVSQSKELAVQYLRRSATAGFERAEAVLNDLQQ